MQKYNTNYIILLFIALAFAAQPTMFRPFGIPLALMFVSIFILFHVAFDFKKESNGILIILIFYPVFLILVDIFFTHAYRGTILAVMLLFVFIAASIKLKENELHTLWTTLAWVCMFLTVLGAYRYLNGYEAPLSENEGGFINMQKLYFYLGISYLPSTRNSDALYFLVGFIASMRIVLINHKFKAIYMVMALLQLVAISLSLARWSYLAVIVAAYLMLRPKERSRAVIVLTCFVIILGSWLLFLSGISQEKLELIYGLLENAVISLFAVDVANRNVQDFYTYSNENRVDLYLASLHQFLEWPIGQGVDNIYFGSANSETDLLHSENLFLDILIAFGVFSFGLFYMFFKKFKKIIQIRKFSEGARISIGIFSACIIFALFNSPLDFVLFWFILAIAFIEGNSALLDFRKNNYE